MASNGNFDVYERVVKYKLQHATEGMGVGSTYIYSAIVKGDGSEQWIERTTISTKESVVLNVGSSVNYLGHANDI